jgi:hypothetical protein
MLCLVVVSRIVLHLDVVWNMLPIWANLPFHICSSRKWNIDHFPPPVVLTKTSPNIGVRIIIYSSALFSAASPIAHLSLSIGRWISCGGCLSFYSGRRVDICLISHRSMPVDSWMLIESQPLLQTVARGCCSHRILQQPATTGQYMGSRTWSTDDRTIWLSYACSIIFLFTVIGIIFTSQQSELTLWLLLPKPKLQSSNFHASSG